MKHGLSTRLEKLESRKPSGRPVILWAGDAEEFERAEIEESRLQAEGRAAILVQWVFDDDASSGQ